MWANVNRKKQQKRSANIKAYLGSGDSEELENESLSSTIDTSSCQSSLPMVSPIKSVLVEIPEELEIASSPPLHFARTSENPCTPSKGQRPAQSQTLPKLVRDDSSAVEEFGNELMDLDNYMLSVFHMSDDTTSVYTKATADTSFSSSSSTASAASVRRRHRGAFRTRRKELYSRNNSQDTSALREIQNRSSGKGSTWVESMRKSSTTIFAEEGGGWTPSKGWQMDRKKKGWDSDPGDYWNDTDPLFDSIKK